VSPVRIAVGGISHETNTFSTLRTRLSDFTLQRGMDAVGGTLWSEVRANDVEVVGTLVAGAPPHGLVEAAAYQMLRDELLDRLRQALPVDGIYLALHGAMEVEGIGDGESDLVRAVRRLVGPSVIIVASLDLHANLAPDLPNYLDAMTALRTAPHRDGAETSARAVALLLRAIRDRRRPVTAIVKLPLLLAGESAVTEVEPARSLYAMLPDSTSRPGVVDSSLTIGCAWTDSPHTSVGIVAVGWNRVAAEREAMRLAGPVWDRREDFQPDVETAEVDEAIRRALAAPEPTTFISDSGDNVTAGGAGDSPLVLERLLAAGAKRAVVAGLADGAAVVACRASGLGTTVVVQIGGKLDATSFRPLRVVGKVASLGEGFAILEVDGVEVVLTEVRRPFTRLADFAEVGIDPLSRKIVVVKLGYLYPELRDQSPRAILALSPGFTDLKLDRLPYRRLSRPIYPLDASATWPPPI
jgi:microcystin degradation protein MlrC